MAEDNERPGIIGVCLSTIQDADRFNLIEALNKAACENGYRLLVFNSCTDLFEQNNLNNSGEASVFRLIPFQKLTAMIVLSNFIFDKSVVRDIVSRCHSFGVPVLSLDKEIEGCYNFRFMYFDCFEQICDHVIRVHGARRLFMVAGIRGNDFSEERVNAFRRSLEDNGIPFRQEDIGYGGFWDGPTMDVLVNWFEVEKRELPDAIICANDTMAVTVSSYLQKKGHILPDECIVTGFDGLLQGQCHIPHLTTGRQDYAAMGQRMVEAVTALSAGEKIPEVCDVGFSVIYSQSCGCKPIDSRNRNDAIQTLIDKNVLSEQRQNLMCTLQSSVSKMKDISELPSVLLDKFALPTNVFALNSDIMTPPDFGIYHRGDDAFTDSLDVIYRHYSWNMYPNCSVQLSELLPDWEIMLETELPIVVCALHFIDLTLGYTIFQTEVNNDEYQKIHTLMSAINASLGNFHSRVQINHINSQLMYANEELERLSVHDYMTGMFNRRGFYSSIARQIDERLSKDPRCSGDGSGAYSPGSLSLIVISADLDELKFINDTFGHIEGDNAINTVSRALRVSAVRDEVCARFGGDEFSAAGIIPAGTEETYFRNFRDRFRNFLEDYNIRSGKLYEVGSSIGYSYCPLSRDADIDAVIKAADDDMYKDKIKRKKERR